jgi:hypothetical protein
MIQIAVGQAIVMLSLFVLDIRLKIVRSRLVFGGLLLASSGFLMSNLTNSWDLDFTVSIIFTIAGLTLAVAGGVCFTIGVVLQYAGNKSGRRGK